MEFSQSGPSRAMAAAATLYGQKTHWSGDESRLLAAVSCLLVAVCLLSLCSHAPRPTTKSRAKPFARRRRCRWAEERRCEWVSRQRRMPTESQRALSTLRRKSHSGGDGDEGDGGDDGG